MSFYLRLARNKELFYEEIYDRTRIAECFRFREYNAAVAIQAWWRGVCARACIKHLNESALKIQSLYRGFRDRSRVDQLLKEKVLRQWETFAHCMAMRIQKVWRGYYSRKYVWNFYERKAHFERILALEEENRQIRAEYREEKEREIAEMKKQMYNYQMKQFAYKNHHLLSTLAQPGVFNSPYNKCLKPWEEHLKSVTFLKHKPSPPANTYTVQEIDFTGCNTEAISNFNDNNDKNRAINRVKYKTKSRNSKNKNMNNKEKFGQNINNKNSNKISMINQIDMNNEKRNEKSKKNPSKISSGKVLQGPFKSPTEVKKQKAKPFLPSLRCSSAYQTPRHNITRSQHHTVSFDHSPHPSTQSFSAKHPSGVTQQTNPHHPSEPLPNSLFSHPIKRFDDSLNRKTSKPNLKFPSTIKSNITVETQPFDIEDDALNIDDDPPTQPSHQPVHKQPNQLAAKRTPLKPLKDKIKHPLHLKDYNRITQRDFQTSFKIHHNDTRPCININQPYNDRDIPLLKSSNKLFKTTLPPIEYFDQINRAY